jgi:hypothetical protein
MTPYIRPIRSERKAMREFLEIKEVHVLVQTPVGIKLKRLGWGDPWHYPCLPGKTLEELQPGRFSESARGWVVIKFFSYHEDRALQALKLLTKEGLLEGLFEIEPFKV